MPYLKMTCVSCAVTSDKNVFALKYEDVCGYHWFEIIQTDTLNANFLAVVQYLNDTGCRDFSDLIGRTACLYFDLIDRMTGEIRGYRRIPLSREV